MRLWHGTNTVPKPGGAGGTGEGQKPMGANFITDPHNEVMGGAREYITSKRFSSISRAQKDNRNGRELLGSNQFRHPREVCHLAYRGARERCVFGATYPLCKATWQRTIFSPKRKLDLRWSYGTVLFVFFKADGVKALFFIIRTLWWGAINVGYAGFGAQAISRSRSPGEKD